MSEEMLVQHCAPTLAGLKTGSLFSVSYACPQALRGELRRFNRVLVPKGLCALPLKCEKGRALVYLYRPARLKGDLAQKRARELLESRGYPPENPNRCVRCLVERLQNAEKFPHEIGLFLSYPPEDVCGFIENGAAHCKCVGCWKVYGDEENAKKRFAQYDKCTRVYCAQWRRGASVEKLAVKS